MKKIFTKILLAVCCVSVLMSVCAASLSVAALAEDSIPTGTPTVDGDIDAIWEYASNKIDIKTSNLGSEADNATGWARLMWDKDAIYVLGYVNDKTASTKITTNPWETDSFEFFINEQNKQVSDNKWIDQFRTDRENRLSGMIAHIISTEAQFKRAFPGIEWASKVVEGSTDYIVEFKIPWKNIEAKKGTKIRIVFQINDDYNNDGYAEGEITSGVVETFNPAMLTEMKLVSTKAEVPKNTTSSNSDAATSSTASTDNNNTQSKTETASKTESAAEDSAENNNSDVEDVVSESTESGENEKENETVTTVTETVNKKLLNTVIIIAAAAILAVAVICTTVIIIAYKKKN